MTTVILPSYPDEFVELAPRSQASGRIFRKQILRKETLHYHGRRIPIDDKFIDGVIQNFRDQVDGGIVQVPLATDANMHSEDPSRNIGEVIDLEKGPDGSLYAVIDARDSSAAGKLGKTLLGASAFMSLRPTDTRTGRRLDTPCLFHVAITNRPHVGGLAPFEEIAASAGMDEDVVMLSRSLANEEAPMSDLRLTRADVDDAMVELSGITGEPGYPVREEAEQIVLGGPSGYDTRYAVDPTETASVVALAAAGQDTRKPQLDRAAAALEVSRLSCDPVIGRYLDYGKISAELTRAQAEPLPAASPEPLSQARAALARAQAGYFAGEVLRLTQSATEGTLGAEARDYFSFARGDRGSHMPYGEQPKYCTMCGDSTHEEDDHDQGDSLHPGGLRPMHGDSTLPADADGVISRVVNAPGGASFREMFRGKRGGQTAITTDPDADRDTDMPSRGGDVDAAVDRYHRMMVGEGMAAVRQGTNANATGRASLPPKGIAQRGKEAARVRPGHTGHTRHGWR